MILLFEKATISATSVAADSTGTNLDFWMIPAANLITISAVQGQVILYFKDGNPYSQTLSTGEALTGSFRFATVTLNVTVTKESEVAENFYKFILAGPKPIVPIPSVRNIFKFSNVTNEFADIADITSIDTIKRYTTYDTISGAGGGGKYSFTTSYRYYAGTANYYVGNSAFGVNNTSPTYTLASIASCTAIDIFHTGILIPFNLSNVGFKVYGSSSGSFRTVDFELLKGTVTANDTPKTDSISLTSVASNTGFTMTSNANMYDISATSSNSVSAGDFLMLAFKGSTGSFYYFTITIYGDI